MKVATYPPKTRTVTRGRPTPPIPTDLKTKKVKFASDNARSVFERRYVRKNAEGGLAETHEETVWRVAWQIASGSIDYGASEEEVMGLARKFYNDLRVFNFVPNSPTWTGAGTRLGQLSACYTMTIKDDMGRRDSGIFDTLKKAALVQQTGGGNGFPFSHLRPSGSIVSSSMGKATGPIGFMKVYNMAFEVIAQGGCLPSNTMVLSRSGIVRLRRIADAEKDGWHDAKLKIRVIGHDKKTHRIKRAFNNGVKPVYKVVTRNGMVLKGTGEHKVRVMQMIKTPYGAEPGFVFKRVDKLQKGDWVVMNLGGLDLSQPKTYPKWNGIKVTPSIAYLAGIIQNGAKLKGDRLWLHLPKLPAITQAVLDLGGEAGQVKAETKSQTSIRADLPLVKEIYGLDEIPDNVLLRGELVISYLRGAYDVAGSVAGNTPVLEAGSENLAQEIASALLAAGIAPKVKGSRVSVFGLVALYTWATTIGLYRIQGVKDDSGRLVALSNDIYNEYQNTVGQAAINKTDVLQARGGQYAFSPTLPFAKYWLQNTLDYITLAPTRKAWEDEFVPHYSINPELRSKILRYVRRPGKNRLTLLMYLKMRMQYADLWKQPPVMPEQFLFVQVAETPKVVGEELTLDIEVNAAHSYVANGFVVHNSRRGANMAVLKIDHPDIEAFIDAKLEEGELRNFNISVGVTDEFIKAVENHADYDLVFPDTTHPDYKNTDGTIHDAIINGIPLKRYKTLNAHDVMEHIAENAWRNGEPGVLFLDRMQAGNPILGEHYDATNPCGEVPANHGESCTLAALNLSRHLKQSDDGRWEMDWDALRDTIKTTMLFLDNVVQVNGYVPGVPVIEEMALRRRKVGMGVLGFADVLYRLGLSYGEPEARNFASLLAEFIRYHAMQVSIELAKERGAFPDIKKSVYNPENLLWEPPKHNGIVTRISDEEYKRYGLTKPDWDKIIEGIKKHGIRNANQLSIAPTGTTSTVSGVEGYGIEPVFALGYTRKVFEGDSTVTLTYMSALLEEAVEARYYEHETKERILNYVQEHGTLEGCELADEDLKRVYVTAMQISWRNHLRMQAVWQAWVDLAISKTINMPEHVQPHDVLEAYLLAWRLGVKGVTVYRENSRTLVVLSRKKKKEGDTDKPKSLNADNDAKNTDKKYPNKDKSQKSLLGLGFGLVTNDHDDEADKSLSFDTEEEFKEWLKESDDVTLISHGYCPVCRNGTELVHESGCEVCPVCSYSPCKVS